MIELHEPQIQTDGGPWATHDHACSVCHKKHSVIDVGTGLFQPCWDCQSQRWFTVKIPEWLKWAFSKQLGF